MQASRASSSIQDSSDHAVLPAVEPVASGQTDFATDDAGVIEVHTEFPDVPYERLDLPRVCESPDGTHEPTDLPQVSELPADQAVIELPANANGDDDPRAGIRPPPEWCVDQGDNIAAMTTFELWMALARGDVDAQTRVWGLGMDNWEIAADVPELAYALTDSLSLAPPPVFPTPTRSHSVRGQDRTPLGFGMTDGLRPDDEGPAQSGPISRDKKRFSLGRVAVAVGGLAAAAALVLSAAPRESPTASASGRQQPIAVARLRGAMERANRHVDEAAHRWMESEAARAVEPVVPTARHKDVGQRRARRGRH
jgi:GYF domain 2